MSDDEDENDDDRTSRLHAFELILDPGPVSGSGLKAGNPSENDDVADEDDGKTAREDKVEMSSFGRLCSRGIPSHPPHLRPQAYFLLLSLLPVQKSQWAKERRRLRKGYYEAVRGYMEGLDREFGAGSGRDGAVGQDSVAELSGGRDAVEQGKKTSGGWLERKGTIKEQGEEKIARRTKQEEQVLLAIARDVSALSSSDAFFSRSRRPGATSTLNPLNGSKDSPAANGGRTRRRNKPRTSIGSVSEISDEGSESSGEESAGESPNTSGASPYGGPIMSRRAIYRHLAKLLLEVEAEAASARESKSAAATSASGVPQVRSLRPALEQRETLFDYGRSPSPSVVGKEDLDGEEDVRRGKVVSPPPPVDSHQQELDVPKSIVDSGTLHSPMITLSLSQDGEAHPAIADGTNRRKRLPRAPEEARLPPSGQDSSSSEPVTLLDSQTLPARKPLQKDENKDLSRPDTYAESLLRLLYVFTRTHKRWEYSVSVTHLGAALLKVYSSGGETIGMVVEQRQRTSDDEADGPDGRCINGWQRHAEANAYWALTGMMNELGGIVTGSAIKGPNRNDLEFAAQDVMRRLRSRVRWADEMLWRGLTLRGLDPGSSAYSHRWISAVFASDIPVPHLLRIWDYVLAESGPDSKIDAIVDISTALLYLTKRDLLRRSIAGVHPATAGQKGLAASLWADSAESPLVDYGDQTRLTEDEKADALFRGTKLLQNYPVQRVGLHEILKLAWELKQERVMASLDGDGPDDAHRDEADVPDEEDLYGYLAPLGDITQLATVSLQHATTYSAPIASSISAGGEKLKQYTLSFQDSDAAAMLAKASTNFSAAALSRWATIGKRPSMDSLGSIARQVQASVSAPEVGSTAGDPSAAGKIWNSLSGTTNPKRASLDQDKFTALPARMTGLSPEIAQQGADLYRRDSSLPPSFISHRGSIVYPAGQYRQRGRGAVGVQSRLQAIASNLTVRSGTNSPSTDRTVPRPLILSGLGGEGAHSTRPTIPTRKTGIERSTARFRTAAKSSRPASGVSQGSESESGPDGQRYSLKDHGAASDAVESPIDVDGLSHQKKYSLTDAPNLPSHRGVAGADLERQDSGDSFHSLDAGDGQGGLARKKVIRKARVGNRPANLKLRKSMDSVASSDGEIAAGERGFSRAAEVAMPSPLLEEESEPAAPSSSRPSGIRGLPRSSRMPSGPRLPGSSSVSRNAANVVGTEPIRATSDDRPAAEEQDDEAIGDKSVDSTVQAQDGYGDLLESYGRLGEF